MSFVKQANYSNHTLFTVGTINLFCCVCRAPCYINCTAAAVIAACWFKSCYWRTQWTFHWWRSFLWSYPTNLHSSKTSSLKYLFL